MEYELLEKLSNSLAISGREYAIEEIIRNELQGIADELYTDSLGNLICHIEGPSTVRLELDAHMDEVGFVVNHIEDDGFLRILPVGGHDPKVVFGQQVVAINNAGETFPGVIGAPPPHIKKGDSQKKNEVPKIEDLFVDIGLPPEKVKKNLSVGDPVVYDSTFKDLGPSFCGKAFDDRMGVFVMLSAVKQAKNFDCDLYVVGTVQEEFGLRGASPAAYNISPDYAIALEGTLANDIPDVPERKQLSQINEGASLRLLDKRMIASNELMKFLKTRADKNNIDYQLIAKRAGTTNASRIQLVEEGIHVATVSVPSRYIHSARSIASKKDIESTVNLITDVIENASQLPQS